MNITTCPLDPFPTSVLIDSDVWLDWLVHIVNTMSKVIEKGIAF